MTDEQGPESRAGAEEELFRHFLAVRDPECPACRYALRDLATPRCPECGLELDIRISLAQPRQAVYINGIVALGAGIGFSGLILGWAASMWLMGGFYPSLKEVSPLIVGLVLQCPALVVWARSWSTFQRRPKALGWGLVVVCWAITILTAVAFFTWVN